MQIKLIKDPFEYIQIDNTYTEEELKLIFLELDFWCYSGNFKQPQETGSAINLSSQKSKKQNVGVFLDSAYSERKNSNILKFNRKIFQIQIEFPSVILNYLKVSNFDTTLISYYENLDHYDCHIDDSILTSLTYVYKQPKAFCGGELFINDYNIKFEPVFNRTYIIPSVVMHSVLNVQMDQKDLNKGLGRYCISGFMFKLKDDKVHDPV